VGVSTRPVFADLTFSDEELSRLAALVRRLVEASDKTFHMPPPKPLQAGMEHLDRLIEKRHLGLEDAMLYHEGVHIHYPDNLESQPKDRLNNSFCSWNSGCQSRYHPDPARQVIFVLNHELAILLGTDREGPFITTAQRFASSFTTRVTCPD